MTPWLSILIPAIFERLDSLKKLTTELERQIEEGNHDSVEIVSVVDNRKVTIGEKRQAVLNCSHGDYVAFVDDDDFVSPHYVHSIVEALKEHRDVDVVTFDNISVIEDHLPICINMRLGQPNEQVTFADEPGAEMPVIKRAAWHTCAWKAGIAKAHRFTATNYGEDWLWAEKLNWAAKTEHHIDKKLHHYIYKSGVSRATA